MAKFTGDTLATSDPALEAATDAEALIAAIDDGVSAVVVQYPDILGRITDLTPIADAAHAKGALLVAVVTEPVALGLIKSPGEMGADIVVGEGQSIGVGLQFGGPYVGLFATREKYVRQMPGRLAGETVDAEGKRGFVLTLSTREQHIRREKATSNICTNSGLCALAFSIHMSLLGEKGLRQLAPLNHARAREAGRAAGRDPGRGAGQRQLLQRIHAAAAGRGAARGPPDGRAKTCSAGVSLGRLYPGRARRSPTGSSWRLPRPSPTRISTRSKPRLRRCPMTVNPSGWRPSAPANAQGETATVTGNRALMLEEPLLFEIGEPTRRASISPSRRRPMIGRLGGLARSAPIGLPGLTEPETVRHYTRLSRQNYAIDLGLFPLGSCTMKHNPRLNEKLARLPGFADIHPLQPKETVGARSR